MRPSKDGLTLRAALLPDFARALADAECIASEGGLLPAAASVKTGGADA